MERVMLPETGDRDLRRVGRRRYELIHAAIRVFSDVGYHTATIKDIADAAGVSVGLIYRYVPDKQELLFLCLRYIVQRNRCGIPAGPSGAESPVGDLNSSIESFFQAVVVSPGAIRLLCRECGSLREQRIDALQRMALETNARIASRIDACVMAGLMSPVNAELLAFRIIMVCHAWDLRHWAVAEPVSADVYLAESVHACWAPHLTGDGRRQLDAASAVTVTT